jgi:hypothetical protein
MSKIIINHKKTNKFLYMLYKNYKFNYFREMTIKNYGFFEKILRIHYNKFYLHMKLNDKKIN